MREKESTAFLKKSSEKLLCPGARVAAVRIQKCKSFLLLFFKKEVLFSLLFCSPAFADPGATIFNAHCALCHQADGHGAPGVAPSLAGTLTRYTTTADGRKYLSQIVLSGMVGKIQTEGHTFSGLMPNFAGDFSDAEITSVINYVLATYNGVAKPVIAPADVAASRTENPVATQTRHLREKVLAESP